MPAWFKDYCILLGGIVVFLGFKILGFQWPNLVLITLLSLGILLYYGIKIWQKKPLSPLDKLNIIIWSSMLLLPLYTLITGNFPVLLGSHISW